MAIEDSQFPDAPETPAAVFAYRAFKGFIFGSPTNNEEGENKENHLQQCPQIFKLKSDQSSKQPNLTPQKRKRSDSLIKRDVDNISSPVKSILRPSGVATPRALHLQRGNFGVTFKDIRKSTSPEAKIARTRREKGTLERISNSPSKVGRPKKPISMAPLLTSSNLKSTEGDVEAECARHKRIMTERADEGRKQTHHEEVRLEAEKQKRFKSKFASLDPKSKKGTAEQDSTQDLENPSYITTVTSQKPTKPSSTNPGPVSENAPFDADDYIRRTEREMKKLVQYGQRMKEYARKQEEENDRLSQALAECRKENERLRKAESERLGRASKFTVLGDGIKRGDGTTGSEIQGHEKQSKRPDLDGLVGGLLASKSAALVSNGKGDRSMPPPARPTQQRGPLNQDLNMMNNRTTTQDRDKEKTVEESAVERQERDRQSSARLAPDRLAAARERIRMKSEKRKASDMSQVDWMKL